MCFRVYLNTLCQIVCIIVATYSLDRVYCGRSVQL